MSQSWSSSGGAPEGRQLYFTFPSAPDPLFKASKAPFLTLRVATLSGARRQAPLDTSNEESSEFRGPVWLNDLGTGQWKWLEEVPRCTSLAPVASPCFVLRLIGVETEGLLDYQGMAGIISIVRWNLRPVIFGVDHWGQNGYLPNFYSWRLF